MKKLLSLLLLLPTLVVAGTTRTIELNKNNTLNFNQAFTADFVAKKQLEAILLCAANIGSTINVVSYSPGGSVSAGQRFFDTLKGLPCKFDTITVFSASMAFQMAQQLGNRYIIPSGTLMSHRAKVTGLSGEVFGELDENIKLLKNTITELDVVAANRAGVTLDFYRNQISDELWMTGTDAVRLKYADEVVLVICDKSLLGTSFQDVQTFMGTLTAEFSDCPIVIGALSVDAANGNLSRDKINKALHYFSNFSSYIHTKL